MSKEDPKYKFEGTAEECQKYLTETLHITPPGVQHVTIDGVRRQVTQDMKDHIDVALSTTGTKLVYAIEYTSRPPSEECQAMFAEFTAEKYMTDAVYRDKLAEVCEKELLSPVHMTKMDCIYIQLTVI